MLKVIEDRAGFALIVGDFFECADNRIIEDIETRPHGVGDAVRTIIGQEEDIEKVPMKQQHRIQNCARVIAVRKWFGINDFVQGFTCFYCFF